MRWGYRDPIESATKARQRRAGFTPKTDRLEDRTLMSIDLANTPTAPYGVQLAGVDVASGVGYSTADVGNVNGSGYDSFLVGAPTVIRSPSGNALLPQNSVVAGNGATAKAYLVFGSQSSINGNATVDWLTLQQQQRTGNLNAANLGSSTQTNPLNGNAGFTFNGLTFTAGSSNNSLLGASVASAGDLNGDGYSDFLIGAPGAVDANGANAGTGRVYLVYGGPQLLLAASANKTIDLDNPSNGINVVTFVNSGNNSVNYQTGFSVAGVGDVLATGNPDIAIGAPGATVDGQSNAGAVYLVSGAALGTASTRTINLQNVGASSNTVAGVILAGANSGDQFGYSVAGAGNVDGSTANVGSSVVSVQDFVVGAPGAGGLSNGAAYLVYGGSSLASSAITTNSVNYINANRIGVTSTTNTIVPGLYIQDSTATDQTGFAVASAGDFNADGFGDFMVSSPGATFNSGRVTMFYGKALAGGRLSGSVDLANLPASLGYVSFTGAQLNAQTGHSLGLAAPIQSGQTNEILIGAPGLNNNSGTVYLIPGNADLQGNYSLTNPEVAPLYATQIFGSNTGNTGGGTYFGSSIGGRLLPTGAVRTVDNDTLGDFLIGASGFALDSTRNLAGSIYVAQGRFIPVQIPVSNAITTTIGVGTAKPPFSINALTPNALSIYVYSNNKITPAFRPVTEINPITVVVNGIAYPNATITADPIDENGDGITDAIVTITPRSNLNLSNGTNTITISGRTFTTAANSNVRWTGSATVTVVGSSSGGGSGGGSSSSASGTTTVGTFGTAIPPYGGRLVPTLNQLSALNYKPIPQNVALAQFKPTVGWRARIVGNGRGQIHPNDTNQLWGAKYSHIQLIHRVFTRGRYVKGQTANVATTLKFHHKQPVVPTQYQNQP